MDPAGLPGQTGEAVQPKTPFRQPTPAGPNLLPAAVFFEGSSRRRSPDGHYTYSVTPSASRPIAARPSGAPLPKKLLPPEPGSFQEVACLAGKGGILVLLEPRGRLRQAGEEPPPPTEQSCNFSPPSFLPLKGGGSRQQQAAASRSSKQHCSPPSGEQNRASVPEPGWRQAEWDQLLPPTRAGDSLFVLDVVHGTK